MLATLATKLGLPILVEAVGYGLSKIDHPLAREAAEALGSVNAALLSGKISPEAAAEANRHVEAMAAMQSEEFQTIVQEVNGSLRAEIASDDKYVRRMRPTFGYMIAVTWGAQMLALAYVVVFETERAALVLQAMESLGTIWAVGLSVLGVYVYKRSQDKKVAAAMPFTLPPLKEVEVRELPEPKPLYND